MNVTWKTQGFYFTEFENLITIAILLIFANCCNLILGWLVNSKFSVGMYRAKMHCILFPCVLIDLNLNAQMLSTHNHVPAMVHVVKGFLSHFCYNVSVYQFKGGIILGFTSRTLCSIRGTKAVPLTKLKFN